MKKIIYTLGGILLTTTLMVGCKANTADAQSKQDTQSASTEDGSSKQKNFQKADLAGEVASINGNKITLKVIKTPEKSGGGNQNNASKDGGDKGNSQGNNKDGQTSKGQGNRQVEYTGETKDITVADGIKISTMNRGQQGSESKDLTISDIKVGDMLQITYSDKEKETISNINVRPAGNQNGSTNTEQ